MFVNALQTTSKEAEGDKNSYLPQYRQECRREVNYVQYALQMLSWPIRCIDEAVTLMHRAQQKISILTPSNLL